MAREEFDKELSILESQLVIMSGMVEDALLRSVKALKNRDIDQSQRVIELDDRIDLIEVEIERFCVDLIRKEAPIASDLRRIITILQISNELERMGDYAEGIGKINIMMGPEPLLKELIDIPEMGNISVDMLKKSINIFMKKEMENLNETATEINELDNKVDSLNEKIVTELLEIVKNDSSKAEKATYLMWASHNIERFADRSTNILERAFYLVSGDSFHGTTELQKHIDS
ncbi:MAG: phosphate transport system regulatory protein PhoU [Chloroflexi bacterium]|nr:phosphate transport system regulatory protein PhoU [Chloroflexota bacterium]|tara:strand:- start:49408 stop:50100 length:693 start_codon:yes stop_codon:yes gene_type:complete